MRRLGRLLAAALSGVGLGIPVAVVVVSEGALRVPRRVPSPAAAAELARATGSAWESARITVPGGAALEAWLFVPEGGTGAAVLLLHGVGDSRLGMTDHARFLLRAGYAVLLPDLRGHGASGGDLITYGLREAGDVRAWCDWLSARLPGARLYGAGRSMGAAVLLQSLAVEPRLRAVVAECPFATFEEIATYRMAQVSGGPEWALRPVANLALLYTRLNYGIDLRRASPLEAIRSTTVPVLLIHGARDTNIPIRHSRELHAANLATGFWTVAGAGHVESLAIDPPAYEARVLDWLAAHR